MPFVYASTKHNASYYPTGETVNGRAIYCLTQSVAYYASRVGKNGTIVVAPEGFLTDLASIPALPCFPRPGGSLWDDAAIVHDRACHQMNAGEMKARDADAIFYYALRDRGCSVFTATVLWLCVRANHLLKGQG